MYIEVPGLVGVWVAKEPMGYMERCRDPQSGIEDFEVLFSGSGHEFKEWDPPSWAGRVVFRMRYWKDGGGIVPFEATGVLLDGKIELAYLRAVDLSVLGGDGLY